MRWITKYRKQRLGALAAAIAVTAWMPTAMAASALPDGLHHEDGVAKNEKLSSTTHLELDVTKGKAVANWTDFSIAPNHSVNFNHQGKGNWSVLNRVDASSKNMSEIYGSLTTSGSGVGTLFLINPNGITFGAGASVEVGSLVASTRELTDNNFTNGNYLLEGTQTAAITNLVNIKAENGLVALIAHKVENKGTINARQVNLVSGDSVELVNLDNVSAKSSDAVLDYDNKIGVLVKSLGQGGQVINSGTLKADNGFVLMKAKDAQNVMPNLVNAEKVSAANRIYKDKDGNMILLGDVNLVGDKVQIADGSKINAESADKGAGIDAESADKGAGTLNILSTNAIIDTIATGNTEEKKKAVISATSLSDTLRDTNVNIVASPLREDYYSDITIGKAITKGKGTDTELVKDTSLTLTAGRNISVDAAITSTAGKLNVQLNGDNEKSTKSKRSDGAVIIRSNIATNGGDFTTTGDNGTYIGLKNDELTKLIKNETQTNETQPTRTIKTKGGNISFGGNEVLLATGNTVELDTEDNTDKNNIKRGSVFVNGTINSANAYSLWNNGSNPTTWGKANEASKKYWGENSTAKSYLAVITGALEDAVISATIPPDTNNKSEAFVGGHVVAVKATEDGTVILKDGKPEVLYNADGTVKILAKNNPEDGINVWYKDAAGNPVRYWAWVDGKEKGTIFFIQRISLKHEATADTPESIKLYHGEKPKDANGNEIYSNFAPNEPNDDTGEGSEGAQTALSVNYSSHDSTQAKNIFYAKWDDVCSNHNKYRFGVVETELSPSSLKIIAGDVTLGDPVTLGGAVGNLSKLDNMTINSTGKVDMNGSVQLNNALAVNAQNDITAAKFIDVGGTADLHTNPRNNGSISTQAITAGGKIKLSAGKDVSIGGKITSHKVVSQQAEQPMVFMTSLRSSSAVPNEKDDIIISAQGSFNNNVAEEDSANALTTDPDRYWKVYADDPANSNMGKLNSNSFALWSWNGTEQVSDEGNMYIFKATPKLTYTAFDKTKRYGETLTDMGYGNSYAVKNSLSGQYTQNFKDGIDADFMVRKTLDGAVTDGVTTSAGYPSTAYVGIYDIDVKGSNVATAWGYDIADKSAKLTVTGNNPEDVKPQLDPHDTTNVDGSASYTTAPRTAPGTDRVLGLQSAELPFFREENGQTKLYGTYDVSIDPDKVKMEPTAKVLPEPDQPKNQYREYDKEITTKVGTAKFKLTYNGSTFDIYPMDIFGKKVLKAGDAAKNVEVESQALFAAFKEMGITLDDLDGVYTHFDNKKEVQSFRK
ncbi:two-partner secretion domain-containing protein [Selenomonas ruminantium]|uniref:Filamentous hemagglutinin family N-terminal domain-containing protein n=1 Tax=Selenomonas ruminantium TaxID=971 RepID=A0A1K1LRJ6_SELRU|nr:filamentous hemagglutinin N-terminal domain-containing protein [Selenomonas ruminantium]SFW13545.1 filamentous hemagglutinin family N-terminal domain-containing protein [Selenomonas ruminantium]